MVSYPGDWEVMKLSDFAEINPHTTIPEKFYYVDLESVKDIYLINARRETKHTAPSRARRYARKGDVFFQTVRPYQRNNYIFKLDGDYVFSTGYAQLRTNNNPDFLFYLVRHDGFVNEVLENCTGTSYPAINPAILAKILVHIPPLKEQTAIANTLAAFDTHITNLTELISQEKAIRDGALDDLMTGRTRLKGFCGDWEVKTLGEIASIQDGTHGTFVRVKLGKLLLSAKNVFDNHLVVTDNESMISQADYNKIISNGYPRIGDILMSCVGTIGRCCLLDRDDIAFQRSVAFIRSHTLYNKYLMFLLQSRNVQKQLASLTNASAQGGIYLNAIKHITLLLTSDKDEQIAIAETLTALDTEISSLENERAKISQIRDGAMNELLTGKVRLKIGI